MSEKAETAGQRINRIRGEMSQAKFGELLGSSQGAVSAWERDDKDRSPSATIYFRLAALAHDPDDSSFFLQQADLEPDAVVSVADILLKKGEVKMDAILATAEQVLKEQRGDQQQRAKEGKDFIVQPHNEAHRLPFEVSVAARLVSNQASTFYEIVGTKNVYARAGYRVEAGEILVFDSREISSSDEILGEKVVYEFEDGLFVGRLGYVAEGAIRYLVLGPPDETPLNWAFHIPNLRVISSSDTDPNLPGHRQPHKVLRYLGLLIAQFVGAGAHDHWKRMARQNKPKR